MHRLTILGAGGKTASGGTWNPGQEASLVAWWDLSTLTSFDTTAKTWTPRYGSGTLTSPGTGPTRITNGFSTSNKNALRFVGTSDTQLSLSNPGVAGMVCVAVVRYTAVSGNPAVYTRVTGSGSGGTLAYDVGGFTARYGGSANSADSFASSVGSDVILVTRHSLAARDVRVNGALDASNSTLNSGDTATNTALILGHYSGASLSWTADVAAFGLFTTASWTTTILEKIEGFVAHQGLGVSTAILPGGHTYKTVAP